MMASEKHAEWSFDEDCETIVPNDSCGSSSDQEDFEVVVPSQKTEFEMISEQKVTSLDANELEIHENYFLLGDPQDSDSDIEVLTKSPDKKNKVVLYSQVLQKKVKENEASSLSNTWDSDGIKVESSKSSIIISDDEDSEIEVLSNNIMCHHNNDTSLEIIFSNEANETQDGGTKITTGNWKDCHSPGNDEEGDYGLKALFKIVTDFGLKALFDEPENCEKRLLKKIKKLHIKLLLEAAEDYGLKSLFNNAKKHGIELQDYGIQALFDKAEGLLCAAEGNVGLKSLYNEKVEMCEVEDDIRYMYQGADVQQEQLDEALKDSRAKPLVPEEDKCEKSSFLQGEMEDFGIKPLFQEPNVDCMRCDERKETDEGFKRRNEREETDGGCKKRKESKETDGFGIKALFERANCFENKSLKKKSNEYGIKLLFESFGERRVKSKNEFISVKTPTLVLILCACVFAGVAVGSGLASLFSFKENPIKRMDTTAAVSRKNMPAELFLFSDTDAEKLGVTNIWFSSNLKKNMRSLLNSFRSLEQQHEMVKASLGDYKERYQLQKQMTWYWRKQVKQNVDSSHLSVHTSINDGMMHTETYIPSAAIRDGYKEPSLSSKRNKSESIESLQKKLGKEQENTRYWKKKYSVELLSMNKCSRDPSTSTFSLSSCLKMFSNITSNLPNFTKPVEKITDHVQNAWGRFKKSWQKNNDDTTKEDAVKRFRKIFTISNVVNFIRPKKSSKDSHVNTEKKYCSKQSFEPFRERWKKPSVIDFPKPEQKSKRKMDENLATKHEDLKVTYKCGEDTLIEIMDDGFPVIQSQLKKEFSKYSNDLLAPNAHELYVEVVDGKIRYSSNSEIHDEAGYAEFREKIGNIPSLQKDKCYVCQYVADIFVESINGKMRTITRYSDAEIDSGVDEDVSRKGEIVQCNKESSIDDIVPEKKKNDGNSSTSGDDIIPEKKENDRNSSSNMVPENNENEENSWYKKRLDELTFHFDLYKWETVGKLKNLMQYVDDNINGMKMKNEKSKLDELKAKNEVKSVKLISKREKRKLKEDLIRLEDIIREKDRKISEWLFDEKLNMKRQLKHVKQKLEKQKKTNNKKIKNAQKMLKSRIIEEYKKLKEKKNSFQEIKKNIVKKVAFYKTKYQLVDEQMKSLQQKYNELINMHSKTKTKNHNHNPKHEKQTEGFSTKWRYPMVYCPDQMNCQQELKNDAREIHNKMFVKPTVFDIAHLYNDDFKLNSQAPSKPIPPRSLLFPKQTLPTTTKQENPKTPKLIPIEPSPPRKKISKKFKFNMNGNDSESIELATPLSWYLAMGQHREELRNEENKDKAIPLNWYIRLMKARDRSHRSAQNMDDFDDDDESDWYLRQIHEREEVRRIASSVSWYIKWMKGRRTEYDNDDD